MIRRHGEAVTFRRLAGTSLTPTDVACHAKFDDQGAVAVDGAVKQVRVSLALDPTNLEAAGLTPVVADDQVIRVSNGATYQIEAPRPRMSGDSLAFYNPVAVG